MILAYSFINAGLITREVYSSNRAQSVDKSKESILKAKQNFGVLSPSVRLDSNKLFLTIRKVDTQLFSGDSVFYTPVLCARLL